MRRRATYGLLATLCALGVPLGCLVVDPYQAPQSDNTVTTIRLSDDASSDALSPHRVNLLRVTAEEVDAQEATDLPLTLVDPDVYETIEVRAFVNLDEANTSAQTVDNRNVPPAFGADQNPLIRQLQPLQINYRLFERGCNRIDVFAAERFCGNRGALPALADPNSTEDCETSTAPRVPRGRLTYFVDFQIVGEADTNDALVDCP